jgi:DNA-binding SARP family transcriptional activator
LALHRGGVNESRLRAALWPETTPTRTAFNETVSRARRCLGLDPEGQPHVRHVDHGDYRVGMFVHLDAELIEAGISGARALERGLPFQGMSGFEWAYEEGLAYSLQRPVDGVDGDCRRDQQLGDRQGSERTPA